MFGIITRNTSGNIYTKAKIELKKPGEQPAGKCEGVPNTGLPLLPFNHLADSLIHSDLQRELQWNTLQFCYPKWHADKQNEQSVPSASVGWSVILFSPNLVIIVLSIQKLPMAPLKIFVSKIWDCTHHNLYICWYLDPFYGSTKMTQITLLSLVLIFLEI